MARIVVVEDSEFLRADLVEELDLWGYEVHQAADGRQGFEVIKGTRPDLVLSDISMPHMNGIELMRCVQALGPAFKAVPFVFLTGLSDTEDLAIGPDFPQVQLITKPVDYASLRTLVDDLLRPATGA